MYYYIFTCKIFFFSYVNEINMRYLLIEQAGQLYLVEICRLLYIWIFYTVHNHWLLAIASDCTSICVYLYCICIFIVQSKINLLTYHRNDDDCINYPGKKTTVKRPLWSRDGSGWWEWGWEWRVGGRVTIPTPHGICRMSWPGTILYII